MTLGVDKGLMFAVSLIVNILDFGECKSPTTQGLHRSCLHTGLV